MSDETEDVQLQPSPPVCETEETEEISLVTEGVRLLTLTEETEALVPLTPPPPVCETEETEVLVPLKPDPLFHKIQAFRLGIAYVFSMKYGCAEDTPETPWKGRGGQGGLVDMIKKDLGIPRGTNYASVAKVMEDVLKCKYDGTSYEVEISIREGRPPIIDIDSFEAQLIADSIESGLSHSYTWRVVNAHRKEELLPSLTIAAVKGCITRLKPKKVLVTKRKQGSNDPTVPWSKARFQWCLHLSVRFTIITPKKTLEYLLGYVCVHMFPCMQEDPPKLPKQFDATKVTKISIYGHSSWDEVHEEMQAGSAMSNIITSDKDFILRFPRNAKGQLDFVNGSYSDEDVSITKVKYGTEVRLCCDSHVKICVRDRYD